MAAAQRLAEADRTRVTGALERVVRRTALPSASIGITRGNETIYAEAFGSAVLPSGSGAGRAGAPRSGAPQDAVRADAEMAYPIGSNSKAFTAACVLLLQERGLLTLDDPVSRWFPELTRASEVSVRNLLTHTSGYADSAPEAYTFPMLTRPTTGLAVVHGWATRPLNFDPGSRYEYTNTNYTLASLLVEKASGMRFHDFLWKNVIEPLQLRGVLDLDEASDRARLKVHGYERYALGPPRPDNLEAPGWYAGAGQLAMPAATLLAWDRSILHRTLLQVSSYEVMETEYKLKDGAGTGYGMGLHVSTLRNGKKVFRHGGVVSGFVSQNVLIPGDDLAYVALTNEMSGTALLLTDALQGILEPGTVTTTEVPGVPDSCPNLAANDVQASAAAKQAAAMLSELQKGRLNRRLLTPDADFYFDRETVEDFRSSLAPLGKVQDVRVCEESAEGGVVFRVFQVSLAKGKVRLSTYTNPDGRLEQFLVSAAQ